MKKTTLMSLLIVSLVALLAVGGTLAWFTDKAEVTNEFTAGTLDIVIDNEYTDFDNWNPGDVTEKSIKVKNKGSKDAYVRVKLTKEWGSYDGDVFNSSDLDTDNVTLGLNEEEWMKVGDFYYYKDVLPAEEEVLLLSSVTLDGPETDNDYQGKVFRITVEADAVQASNNAYQDENTWDLEQLPWELEPAA
ncbi:MAG: BsaA family SipW-dependent biofilm matrix protein [Bacillota bacterium]